MINKIIIIDDEIKASQGETLIELIEENLKNLEIIKITSVIDFQFNYLNLDFENSIVLLDMIMPFYDIYSSEETNEGISTGLVILDKIRQVNSNCVILIFSIRNRQNFRNLDKIKTDYNVSKFIEKHKVSNFDLIKILKEFI